MNASRNRKISRGLAVILALVLAAAAGPRVAFAAPASPSVRESLDERSRARFDDALTLYQAKRYAEAREAFVEAHAASREPRILYNIAVCEKAMGRYARAILTLRKSLTQTDRALDDDYARRVSETVATLSRYVAYVALESNVGGVTFFVDAEPVTENPVPVEAGTRSLEARKDGYVAQTRVVEVKAGETRRERFALEVSPELGTATVSCSPEVGEARCQIELAGEPLGAAPVTLARPPGRYPVRALVGGREWGVAELSLEKGRATELVLVARGSRAAQLRVTSDRPDDKVFIDGALRGTSGVALSLDAGAHRVLVAREGGTDKTIELTLRESETRDLRVTLEPKRGPSPWWFVAGGVVAAAATVSIVVLLSRPTTFEGDSAGTLDPYTVPAAFRKGN